MATRRPHASVLLVPVLVAAMTLLPGSAAVAASGAVPAASNDVVDEIHYEYGTAPGTVVLAWRGSATTVSYGTTAGYGREATATVSPIKPVDIAGPFEQATLTGLAAGTTYHYRIGAAGADHTLRAAPTGDFRFADIGDTASTRCDPWMAAQQQLIADQSPNFVTHGGDISYANECGVPAVHRYFTDQQVWSESAAFQPAWGNHEYGPPTSEAPPGTPRDSMANYKGRVALTNAHTLPSSDTAKQTGPPGCAGPATGNNCRGQDWGWFRAGGVLFIAYPEPWFDALTDWEPQADALMAAAQDDPGVDFVVTYGHRPAYSSAPAGPNAAVKAALTKLAAKYSPTAAHPDGKYVLTIGHHIHAEEVFSPIGGLVEINNGGGGSGQVTFGTPAAHSIFRYVHPAILRGDYDASAHSLTMRLLCGAVYTPKPKNPCTYGATLYTRTFTPGYGG
ncbi:MAG TPA: metallophosphoesterase family protein [Micromonosporaceae bacterium]|nr:metallophosphoesterase family protein [Micromonosporaceae bacterium]